MLPFYQSTKVSRYTVFIGIMTALLHTKPNISIIILFVLSETLQVPSAVVQPQASPVKRQQSKNINIAYLDHSIFLLKIQHSYLFSVVATCFAYTFEILILTTSKKLVR